MKPKSAKQPFNPLLLYALAVGCLIVLNFVFIGLIGAEANTTKLLKNELGVLEQEERIITSAQQIYSTYQDEIDTISSVFPNEETIPLFIQTLEDTIRANSDEYSLRFTAITPIKDQDKLFLPLSITMRTDLPKLILFLDKIEKLPYMTHVTSIFSKTPDGFTRTGEIQIGVKVYVQNPFTTK